jgi:hypothetical protein
MPVDTWGHLPKTWGKCAYLNHLFELNVYAKFKKIEPALEKSLMFIELIKKSEMERSSTCCNNISQHK